MPTFRQVEAFQAVMTNGSVTRAATALGLGQPAVSRLIGDFETAVGLRLFDRAARSLVPTAKARELAREIERSFLGMDHIRSTVRRLVESDLGALRIAVVPSLLAEIVPDLIGAFSKTNPGIAISVEVATTLETAELLETLSCDFGFTSEIVHAYGLRVSRLARHSAVCAVPRGHRFARLGRALQLKDFRGERFVSFMPASRFRQQLDRIFEAAGIQRDLRFEARTTAAACEMALALEAATVLPVAPRIGKSAELKLLAFRPMISSEVVLLRHRHRTLTPAAQLFEDFVEAAVADNDAERQRGVGRTRCSAKGNSAMFAVPPKRQPGQGRAR